MSEGPYVNESVIRNGITRGNLTTAKTSITDQIFGLSAEIRDLYEVIDNLHSKLLGERPAGSALEEAVNPSGVLGSLNISITHDMKKVSEAAKMIREIRQELLGG